MYQSTHSFLGNDQFRLALTDAAIAARTHAFELERAIADRIGDGELIVPRDSCVYQPRGAVVVGSGVALADGECERQNREKAFRLADEIIASHQSGATELPETELTHYFADGCYFRQLVMPAGIIGVAMVHKHEHIVHVAYGDFYIVEGSGRTRMTGSQTFISRPGAQRCFVVLADTMISTVHRMRDPSCTDIEEVERMFFCRSEEEFQEYLKEETKCLVC